MTRREQQRLRDLIGAQRYHEELLAELRLGWKDCTDAQKATRHQAAQRVQLMQRDVKARLDKIGAKDDVAHA